MPARRKNSAVSRPCAHHNTTANSTAPTCTQILWPSCLHSAARQACRNSQPLHAPPATRRAAAFAPRSSRPFQPAKPTTRTFTTPLIKLPWHTGAQQARIPARAACRVKHSYCSLTNASGLAELLTAALLAAATCCSAGAPQLEGYWHPARGCLAAGPCLCKACSSSPCWEVLVRMPATPWKQAVTTHMHAQPDTVTLLLRLQLHLGRSCSFYAE